MKKTPSLLAITMITAMILLTVPSVQAITYSSHATDATGCWHVWVTVDTTAETLKVEWAEQPFLVLGYWFFGSYIHVWDGDGHIYWWDAPLLHHISGDGEMTFDYCKTDVTVHAEIRWCYDTGINFGVEVTVRCDLYVGNSGVFGCPILSVWNGAEYFEEGLLDIHNAEGFDVTYQHTLTTDPEQVNNKVLLRLVEHPQTHSYIDQVKLYATLEDGTTIELPLMSARHSESGNVLPQLLSSDEWKTDILGAEQNNGTSQSIDLKFAVSASLEITSFTFQIEGNNRITKR